MARSDIRFLLGFEPQSLEGIDPNRTLLDWLREDKGRTGSKEGCAEGDCGACTVVLGHLERGALRYKPVNACILFLPQLDGHQLITIEHLRNEEGQLHRIQQAMVDHHGSQCGFCTPGFIMSLFAFSKGPGAAEPNLKREAIGDALAGNLCRCTGYRPILDAASDALDRRKDDVFSKRESETVKALKALDVSEPLSIESHGRTYLAPTSLGGLMMALKPGRAQLLAGGTDMGLWVTKQHRDLDRLIDVTRVPELKRIVQEDGALKIGAACTYEDAHVAIRERFSDFGELIRRIGGAQVRAAGTIGGNIANGSPIGDTMPALIALGARLVLMKEQRQRTLALEDFYLGYRETALEQSECVAEVQIPLPALGAVFKCYKISKRHDQDISAVLGAFALELSPDQNIKKIRIAFGGMAALPKRAVETELSMIGKPWNEATIEAGKAAIAHEFSPLSDMRASADYRLTVAQHLLRKTFIETTEPLTKTRITAGGGTGSRRSGYQ